MTAYEAGQWTGVVYTLRGHRYRCGNEADFQEDVATVLAGTGLEVKREHRLSAHDRADFYLPALRCALELKVHGSPHTVLRQLMRYSHSPDVERLVLLTTHARLGTLARYRVVNGKPLEVVTPWMGRAF